MKVVADKRYQEKKDGIKHEEDVNKCEDYRAINDEAGKVARKEFEEKVEKEMKNDLEQL
jgi:hypothetical protein